MYSDAFMKYLINYQKEDSIVEEECPKKISFKDTKRKDPIKVTINIKN